MIAKALGDRTYPDTNVLIYFVEGHAIFRDVLNDLFGRIQGGAITAVTSELSLAEVLVKPFVEKNVSAAAAYRRLLAKTRQLRWSPSAGPSSSGVPRREPPLGGRAFDAIHVATALGTNCVSVLSEDARLRVPATVRLVRLSELSAGRRE